MEWLGVSRRLKGLTEDFVDQRKFHVIWVESAQNAGQEDIANLKECCIQFRRNAFRKTIELCELAKKTARVIDFVVRASGCLASAAMLGQMKDSYSHKQSLGRLVHFAEQLGCWRGWRMVGSQDTARLVAATSQTVERLRLFHLLLLEQHFVALPW